MVLIVIVTVVVVIVVEVPVNVAVVVGLKPGRKIAKPCLLTGEVGGCTLVRDCWHGRDLSCGVARSSGFGV